ncbi:hypothetical protein CYMTET_16109, partial [Cymbomonas tetramitiformis]
ALQSSRPRAKVLGAEALQSSRVHERRVGLKGGAHESGWLQDEQWRLRLHVKVENTGFGNPPGFPHVYFVSCNTLLLDVSMTLVDFFNFRFMAKNRDRSNTTTTLSRKKSGKQNPLRKAQLESYSEDEVNSISAVQKMYRQKSRSKFKMGDIPEDDSKERPKRKESEREEEAEVKRLGMIRIERLELQDVHLNFEMHNGVFNINGFSSYIARGELIRAGCLKPGEPCPNTLLVRVIRAVDLKASDLNVDGTRTSDPKVVITARTEVKVTRTQMRTLNPMWNETFQLHCKDPSTVLHLTVWDEDLGVDDFLGQWRMTVKYLLLNHQHSPCKGWFKLCDRKFRKEGCGEIELEVSWVFVDHGENWNPPQLTALQQMQENSAETSLRMGNTSRVQKMLMDWPFLFDPQLIVFRNIHFHLRDLFKGYGNISAPSTPREAPRGSAETEGSSRSRRADSSTASDVIRVKLLELTPKYMKPPKGSERGGLTLWEVCLKLVMGVAPQVMQGSIINNAANAIFGGLKDNFSSEMVSVFTKLSTSSIASSLQDIAHQVNVGTQEMMRHVGQAFGHKVGDVISADDKDFLSTTLMLGYIELKKPRGRKVWKIRRLEHRGLSMFYSKFDGEETVWTRKLELAHCKGVHLRGEGDDANIELEMDLPQPRLMQLRLPSTVFPALLRSRQPTLFEWVTALRECVPHHHNREARKATHMLQRDFSMTEKTLRGPIQRLSVAECTLSGHMQSMPCRMPDEPEEPDEEVSSLCAEVPEPASEIVDSMINPLADGADLTMDVCEEGTARLRSSSRRLSRLEAFQNF